LEVRKTGAGNKQEQLFGGEKDRSWGRRQEHFSLSHLFRKTHQIMPSPESGLDLRLDYRIGWPHRSRYSLYTMINFPVTEVIDFALVLILQFFAAF
jgi:hypothetical protein